MLEGLNGAAATLAIIVAYRRDAVRRWRYNIDYFRVISPNFRCYNLPRQGVWDKNTHAIVVRNAFAAMTDPLYCQCFHDLTAWIRNSRLPSFPVIGESMIEKRRQPRSSLVVIIFSQIFLCIFISRIMPFLLASGPASN